MAGKAGDGLKLQDALGWHAATLAPFPDRRRRDADEPRERSDAFCDLNRDFDGIV